MKTLRSKLLLAMLSIALIITVLLSLVSVYFINVSAKDTLKSTAEPLAVQAAKNFDSTISSYTNNIVSTVKSDSFLGAKTDADRLKAVKSGFADNTGQSAEKKGMFVMTDGKRNDIGATMEAYATAHLGLRFVEPLRTLSPALTSTGRNSPVSADVSSSDSPSVTIPSRGILSPCTTSSLPEAARRE